MLPQGPVAFALGDTAGAAGTAALPLTLQAAGSTPGAALTAQVQMLDKAQAAGLSPLGFAFALQLHDSTANVGAASNQLPPASQALTLTVNYSRIPMAQVGDVRGRLALYRATGCGQASPDLAAGTVSDTTEARRHSASRVHSGRSCLRRTITPISCCPPPCPTSRSWPPPGTAAAVNERTRIICSDLTRNRAN